MDSAFCACELGIKPNTYDSFFVEFVFNHMPLVLGNGNITEDYLRDRGV